MTLDLGLGFKLIKSEYATSSHPPGIFLFIKKEDDNDTIATEAVEKFIEIPNITSFEGGRLAIPIFNKFKDNPICNISKLDFSTCDSSRHPPTRLNM